MSSYITLSQSCCPVTPALTSNQKFLMPWSQIYCKCCTPMTRYPGRDLHCCPDPIVKNPVSIPRNKCKSCTAR